VAIVSMTVVAVIKSNEKNIEAAVTDAKEVRM